MSYIEAGPRPEWNIHAPSPQDFKIVYLSFQQSPSLKYLEPIVELSELLPIVEDLDKEIFTENQARLIKRNSQDPPVFSIHTLFGRPGGGKGAVELLLNKEYEEWTRNLTEGNYPIYTNWDELRNVLDWGDLLKKSGPLDVEKAGLLTKRIEQDFTEELKRGYGIRVLILPAGTDFELKDGEFIIGRNFAPQTLFKLATCSSPFDRLNKKKLNWTLSAAIVANPIVTVFWTRYREVLQYTKSLSEIKFIEEVFMREPINDVLQLSEAEEGGTAKHLSVTTKVIIDIFGKLLTQGKLGGFREPGKSILTRICLDAPDAAVVNLTAKLSPAVYNEAEELAFFITSKPTYQLMKEIIQAIVLLDFEVFIHLNTNLRIPNKAQLIPDIRVILKNSPSLYHLVRNIDSIREIFRKYNVV